MSEGAGQTKYCSNCKQDIAAANFVMHEVHCRRNIILCPKCSEPVPRSKLEEHEDEEHALVPCSICQKNFEKSEIDTHTENCPRRPVQCVYCEIECPRDELQGHMEYCGTRTEQCLKCNRFIMHKDLLKHEETICQFPPEQQQQQNNASGASSSSEPRNRRAVNGRYGDESDLRSSFVSRELERFMTNPGASTSQSRYNPMAYPPTVNNNQATSSGVAQRNTSIVKKRNPIAPKNVNQRVQKTDNSRVRNNTGVGGNRNVMRDSDLDDLLARQLANDLNLNGENELHHNLLDEYSSSNRVTDTNQVHASGSTDDPGIPCEYCGDEYPLSSLLQHQTNCDANEGASNGFGDSRHNTNGHTPVNSRPPVLNNASGASNEATNNTQNFNFINNLDMPLDLDWSPSEAYNSDFGDGVMIPCEFCDDVFPQEMLFHHQPVCNKNPFKTPRVMTPKVSNSTRNSHLSTNLNFNTRSSNRNSEPKLTSKDRPPGLRNGANRVSSNTPSGNRSPEIRRRTPEIRKATTVNKTRTVLNEFMHNPSYTPVNLPPSSSSQPKSVNGHTGVVGGARIGGMRGGAGNGGGAAEGYQPTAMSNFTGSSSRVSSKPRVVQRRNYDTSVLGDNSRVTSRNQAPGSTDSQVRNTKPKTRRP